MITTRILQRVLKVRRSRSHKTGTAFTIDSGENQYLVSAKHVFEEGTTVQIAKITPNENKEIWETADTTLPLCNEQKDIIVFPLKEPIISSFDEVVEGELPGLGQDVYILGFMPLSAGNAYEPPKSFPFPFVKKGTIAGYRSPVSILPEHPRKDIYIDARIHPGFSGAPVVFLSQDEKIRVIGIINGHFSEGYDFGNEVKARLNSGIAHASYINNALKLIEEYEKST